MARLLGILLLLICCWQTSKAQDRQYIVKINGDTIYGRLMINPIRDNSREMFFKSDDGTKERVRPLRTTYAYYNPKYQFRSVIFSNQRLFMQIVREDEKVSLYNYVHDRDNSLVNSRVAVKSNGEAIELSVLNFKNQIREFLDDCPELIAKLEAKQYKFKTHQAMFADYNQCDVLQYTTTSALQAQTQVQTQPSQPVTPSSTTPTSSTPPGTPVANEVSGSVAVPAVATTDTESGKSDIQLLRLRKLQEFKEYVVGLQNFQFSKDVLDLVVDLENRINQNSEIPAYLWTTLDAMVEDNEALKEQAQQLKLDIR